MARILLTWELGAGLGHLLPHRELVRRLIAKGHHVAVAARDVSKISQAFPELPIAVWQAPISTTKPEAPYKPTLSLPQILWNVGFSRPADLAARIAAWRNLSQAVQPDLIWTDYSPTALLASRAGSVPRLIINTGFFVPPAISPLPPFSVFTPQTPPEELQQHEGKVLEVINAALRQQRLPVLSAVHEIFTQAEQTWLQTYRELDHYPQRIGGENIGVPLAQGGRTFEWPAGTRRRIFAYLKPFPVMETLFGLLNQLELPTVISSDGIPQSVQQKFQSATLHFHNEPLDIHQAGRECSVAITNANHTTMAQLLQYGKPAALIPLHLEQELVANAITRGGAGVTIRPQEVKDVYEQLQKLLNHETCAKNAAAFATHYGSRPPLYQPELLVERIETLIAGRPPAASA